MVEYRNLKECVYVFSKLKANFLKNVEVEAVILLFIIDFLSFWLLRQYRPGGQKRRENLNVNWKSNVKQNGLKRDSKMLLYRPRQKTIKITGKILSVKFGMNRPIKMYFGLYFKKSWQEIGYLLVNKLWYDYWIFEFIDYRVSQGTLSKVIRF